MASIMRINEYGTGLQVDVSEDEILDCCNNVHTKGIAVQQKCQGNAEWITELQSPKPNDRRLYRN